MNQEEYVTINIRDIGMILYRKLAIILLAAVVGGLLGLWYAVKTITPMYKSQATLIVNTQQDNSTPVNSDQYSTARNWANTYSIIIKSDTVLEEVIRNLNLNYSFDQVNRMVAVDAIDNTQVLQITVSCADGNTSYRIADELIRVIPETLEDKVGGVSVKVISDARLNPNPVNTGKNKYVVTGGAIGLALACALILLLELTEDKVRSEEELSRIMQAPVIGVIPECHMEE